jgi:hypothetical protein
MPFESELEMDTFDDFGGAFEDPGWPEFIVLSRMARESLTCAQPNRLAYAVVSKAAVPKA